MSYLPGKSSSAHTHPRRFTEESQVRRRVSLHEVFFFLNLIYFLLGYSRLGLPRWLSGKESTCNAGDAGLIPRLERCPREGNACLGNLADKRAWRSIVHGITKFSSVQFSHSVMSNSLRPHELQHARPPCPSPTPGADPTQELGLS